MRTMLRGKVTLLFMTLGMLLALPTIALADRLDADADTLATGTGSSGNSLTANQQPGTTVTYPFSAAVTETGNATDNVFVNAGDKVTVNNSFAGDWLDAAGSSPASFEITAYGQNHSGVISVTVPCNAKTTIPADSKAMTVSLSATASNGKALVQSPDLTYTITASGSPAASCAPANSNPVINSTSGPTTVSENKDTVNGNQTFSVNASDSNGDTLSYQWTVLSGNAQIIGSSTGSSAAVNFPDGADTVALKVEVSDGKGGTASHTFNVTVNNVAPSTSLSASNPLSVNESSTQQHTYNYTISDPGADTVSSVSTSCGTNGEKVTSSDSNTDTSGSFKCKFDDGTKQSTVSAQATDSDLLAGTAATQTVDIANVIPTVTGIAASAQNALVGKNVSFMGSASDVSSADQTAGFAWQWSKDGGAFTALPNPFVVPSGNPFVTSFADCGPHSVSAMATDKDLGTSNPPFALANPVNVYNASFSPPVDAAPYVNTVQKGRVIPVKISVSCNGNIANLSPSIQLLLGDKTDGSEITADELETYSVSAADTTGIMRAADGSYIYNLRVPDVANAYYTIRVNPFGGNNASSNMYALLKTRK
jgi:hypothetical protein